MNNSAQSLTVTIASSRRLFSALEEMVMSRQVLSVRFEDVFVFMFDATLRQFHVLRVYGFAGLTFE